MKKSKLIFRKKYKSSAEAVRSYARRHKAAGLCRYCSNRPNINPRTGKFYLLCPYHLKRVAGRQKLIMRKRRRIARLIQLSYILAFITGKKFDSTITPLKTNIQKG
jgi:hypothetical protein